MIVVREVRRAANNAAVNLGLQQHQQSTSSNSVVPTVMLVTTSLIYVLLNGTWSVIYLVIRWMPHSEMTWDVINKVSSISLGAYEFVFCYNFYVYLATGKQFRCELHKLFCRCSSAAAEAAAPAPRQRADLADTPSNVSLLRPSQLNDIHLGSSITSPRLCTNRDSMLATPARTDLSQTCRYCRSSWSASSSAS